MRAYKSLAKWRAGESVLGTTLHVADPSVYEMVSLMGFDLIWIDLEHHSHSVETASGLMRVPRLVANVSSSNSADEQAFKLAGSCAFGNLGHRRT